MIYPNGSFEDRERGSFVYNDPNGEAGRIGFSTATSYLQSQKWVKPLLFNFERKYNNGAISTQDEEYAAFLQEAFDEHTDAEIHAWAFDLPEASASTHGNGLVWDKTTDELRILETIVAPQTDNVGYPAEDAAAQQSPLIEDSNYLPPDLRAELGGQTNSDNTAYQHWWHPLRFDGTTPSRDVLTFRDGKSYAATMFIGAATGQDADLRGTGLNTAPTTNYLTTVVSKFRTYNRGGVEMQALFDQARLMQYLSNVAGDYAIGGSAKTPVYAVVSGASMERLWEDQDGTLVDYVADLDQETYDNSSLANDPLIVLRHRQLSGVFREHPTMYAATYRSIRIVSRCKGVTETDSER